MKILKPIVKEHDGSSLRELIDLWKERSFCEVEEIKTNHYPSNPDAKCWVGETGNILLYDFPLLDHLQVEYDKLKSSLRKSFSERSTMCGFIGVQTTGHRQKSADYWSRCCDVFHMYTVPFLVHEEYLKSISNFRFGLCLPGVGPKCLRDIELMGLGVVPIFTPQVSTNYHNELKKDVHYLVAETPEDVIHSINNCSREKWEYISQECIKWFEKNCSIEGSFNTTMEIIEKGLYNDRSRL